MHLLWGIYPSIISSQVVGKKGERHHDSGKNDDKVVFFIDQTQCRMLGLDMSYHI